MRSSDMPGARTLSTDTMISTAAQIADTSTNVTPISQKSALMPGVYVRPASGVYMNQPPSGASPASRENSRIAPPNR